MKEKPRAIVAGIPRSDAYGDIDWAVRIIGGATISIFTLQIFSDFLAQAVTYTTQTTVTNTYQNGTLVSSYASTGPTPVYHFLSLPYVYFFFPAIAFFYLLPFLLSLALSKKDVELRNLRIVPPLAIGLPTAAYGFIFLLNFSNVNSISFLYGMMGLFALVATSAIEDRWAVSFLGTTAERESIYFEKLRVAADIDDVKARLIVPEIANVLNIRDTFEGKRESGYKGRSPRLSEITTKIGLSIDRQDARFTIVNVAFYVKARFMLRLTNYLGEYAQRQSAYLYRVLTEWKPILPAVVVIPLSNSEYDPYIDEVIDDLRGFYVQTRRAPRRTVIAVVLVTILTIGTAISLVSGQSVTISQATGFSDALVAIIAALDFLSKRP